MSDLIVIGYDDEKTAETVLDDLLKMERDYLVDLKDAAVVFRDKDGQLHVHTRHHYLGHGTLTGMFWGLIVGLIFLVPVAGFVFGGLVGLVAGAAGDLGMKQDFKDEVGALVQPGKSALMAVIRKATPDKVLEELSPYGGTVLRTSLTHDDEDKLAESLREKKAVAT
jgi:uncharacterized membrane protein